MNVEGDFRYVDSGAFYECADFLKHLEICDHNWEEAFVGWAGVSKRWKEDHKVLQDHWDPWNLVKVSSEFGFYHLLSCFLEILESKNSSNEFSCFTCNQSNSVVVIYDPVGRWWWWW